MQIRQLSVPGYESVVCGTDESAGYQGIVFIHSTALGPAVGGTRLWSYNTEQDAITDGLRLSRGMTYKNALAGLPCGGGKSIIMRRDGKVDREGIFRAHGRLVDSLNGKYITAEDVGTSPADMEWVLKQTKYVAGLQGRSGDPSPKTARGVFRSIQAAAKQVWQNDDLAGKTVAIQGCGHVGYYLAAELSRGGAKLLVADVDQSKVDRVVREFGARQMSTGEVLAAEADVLAPCALGGIINDQTIPRFRTKIIAGGANNQLLESRHGDALEERGVLYAPDYAANAGGVINGCCREMLGWNEARTIAKVDDIYETLLKIFAIAKKERIPTYRAADRLAEERLSQKVA